jgi:hypothetical protein
VDYVLGDILYDAVNWASSLVQRLRTLRDTHDLLRTPVDATAEPFHRELLSRLWSALAPALVDAPASSGKWAVTIPALNSFFWLDLGFVSKSVEESLRPKPIEASVPPVSPPASSASAARPLLWDSPCLLGLLTLVDFVETYPGRARSILRGLHGLGASPDYQTTADAGDRKDMQAPKSISDITDPVSNQSLHHCNSSTGSCAIDSLSVITFPWAECVLQIVLRLADAFGLANPTRSTAPTEYTPLTVALKNPSFWMSSANSGNSYVTIDLTSFENKDGLNTVFFADILSSALLNDDGPHCDEAKANAASKSLLKAAHLAIFILHALMEEKTRSLVAGARLDSIALATATVEEVVRLMDAMAARAACVVSSTIDVLDSSNGFSAMEIDPLSWLAVYREKIQNTAVPTGVAAAHVGETTRAGAISRHGRARSLSISNAEALDVPFDAKSPMPEIVMVPKPSAIATPLMISAISTTLPLAYREHRWRLLYDLSRDGGALQTMLARARDTQLSVILVQDIKGAIFGGLCTESWSETKATGRYYGSGTSFVFTFEHRQEFNRWRKREQDMRAEAGHGVQPTSVSTSSAGMNSAGSQFHVSPPTQTEISPASDANICLSVYKTSRLNCYYQFCNSSEGIGMGGGGSFAFYLDADSNMHNGHSGFSLTFLSPCLASSSQFTIASVELWGLEMPSL